MPDASAARIVGMLVLAAGLIDAAPARADVVISSAQTQNMSCSAGVCAPTAASAVLNANDLKTMLDSGGVKVTTTGSGVQANNIDVTAPFSWSTANALSLDACQSIVVARHVSVAGLGGLSLTINDGGSNGTFSTGHKGRVSFANLSSALTINDTSYVLVNSVKSLASAIAINASGDYALADNYDASKDGTYSNTPVTTTFSGVFEGLGNMISNLSVKSNERYVTGMFVTIAFGGTVENLGLDGLAVEMGRYNRDISQYAAGLVELNEGMLFNDYVSGMIKVDAKGSGAGSLVGGLVAENYSVGSISNSSSTASVEIVDGDPGGLAGQNLLGTITGSFSTGNVKVTHGGGETPAGGFASDNDDGTIINSYSTGSVKAVGYAPVGGFLGYNSNATVSSSYSTGRVTTKSGGLLGGFVANDEGTLQYCYWDTQTSGTSEGTGNGNVSGLTGLTTKQFKSGLPTGFDPTIWAEDKKINNGFPYLIANPPRE